MTKPTLIHTWGKYRLLKTRGSYGAYDHYDIECDYKDSLGEPKWTELHSWTRDGAAEAAVALTALVDLVEPLLRELASFIQMRDEIRAIVEPHRNTSLIFGTSTGVKEVIERLIAERDAALARAEKAEDMVGMHE